MDGPLDIYKEKHGIVFDESGTFTVETNDLAMLGDYELRICAYLEEHPQVETIAETIVPLQFLRCAL